MKEYYGNYLGLCINNDDPEKRGRVQVFIPHIMPALFDNWNDVGEDIKLVCVGDNLPSSLPGAIVDRLKLMLPWAESASPILGTSAPGNLIGTPSYGGTGSGSSFYSQSPVPDAEGYAAGIANIPPGELGAGVTGDTNLDSLIANARGEGISYTGSQSRCGVGTRRMVGALLGNDYFKSTGLGGFRGYASDTSLGGYTGNGNTNIYFQKSGLYNTPVSVDRTNYLNDPSQWRIGDVVSSKNASRSGAGHIQVYVGNGKWVSDFSQGGRVLQGGYVGHTLHRLNSAGIAQLQRAGKVNNLTASGGGVPSVAATQGSGYVTPSTSGQLAAASPHQNPNPIGDSTSTPSRYGSVADPTVGGGDATGSIASGTLPPALNGDVSPAFRDQYNRVFNLLNGSRFVNTVPNDGARYGITTGSQAEWANFFTRLASVESGFNPNTAADINGKRQGPLTSFGLYQMGTAQFNTFGGGNIYNADNNTSAFIRYAESMYFGAGAYGRGGGQNVLTGRSGNQWLGLAAGYGPLRRTLTGSQNTNESKLLSDNINSAQVAGGDVIPSSASDVSALAASGGQMVQNQDPHGPTAVMDINNMAGGMFSYPAAGALIWCFFREGNPLYPVYFAASYGQTEWQSAYRYNVASPAQDGSGYKPAATPENPVISVGGRWNIGKVGALTWTDETDPNNPVNNQKSLMLASHDGSNMFFNEGYHQIFSKYDRRDQVEGDRWETTLGQKEEWVQGDSNLVVMGDMFVKVGNVGPEATEAVENIQSIIKECMQPLTEPRDCSGSQGRSSTTKPKNKFTKQAEQNSRIPRVDDTLFKINNISSPTISGIKELTPSPSTASTIPNTTSTARNPAVGNPFAQEATLNQNVRFVPSTFRTGTGPDGRIPI